MASAKFGSPLPKKALSEGNSPDEYLRYLSFENVIDFKAKDNIRYQFKNFEEVKINERRNRAIAF